MADQSSHWLAEAAVVQWSPGLPWYAANTNTTFSQTRAENRDLRTKLATVEIKLVSMHSGQASLAAGLAALLEKFGLPAGDLRDLQAAAEAAAAAAAAADAAAEAAVASPLELELETADAEMAAPAAEEEAPPEVG